MLKECNEAVTAARGGVAVPVRSCSTSIVLNSQLQHLHKATTVSKQQHNIVLALGESHSALTNDEVP